MSSRTNSRAMVTYWKFTYPAANTRVKSCRKNKSYKICSKNAPFKHVYQRFFFHLWPNCFFLFSLTYLVISMDGIVLRQKPSTLLTVFVKFLMFGLSTSKHFFDLKHYSRKFLYILRKFDIHIKFLKQLRKFSNNFQSLRIIYFRPFRPTRGSFIYSRSKNIY